MRHGQGQVQAKDTVRGQVRPICLTVRPQAQLQVIKTKKRRCGGAECPEGTRSLMFWVSEYI